MHFRKDVKQEQVRSHTHQPEEATTTPMTADANSADIVSLQRYVGNQGVQRMLADGQISANAAGSTFIQAKLSVGPANDAYEQEADNVAKQVVAQSATQDVAQRVDDEELAMKRVEVQRQAEDDELDMKRVDVQRQAEDDEELAMKRADVQRQADDEELAMKRIQRKSSEAGFEVDGDIEQQINSAKGGGQSLPDTARSQMESGFGADFSGVRVHTDAQSDALNRSLDARAFTTGSDIFFRSGEYNPSSSSGQELLAHELTHVVQQGAATVQTKKDES